MNAKKYTSFFALKDTRDQVLLLSLGNEFLCEKPYLIKIGTIIGSRIDLIQEEIVLLKKKFPGRFASEVSTDDFLETLREVSGRLQKPNEEIQSRCKTGELAQELEKTVKSLAHAISSIQTQVEGKIPSFSRAESTLSFFRRLRSVGFILSFVAKLSVFLLAAMILLFSYLFFTMEKADTFLTLIDQDEENIRFQNEKLSELILEKQTLSDKIQRMRRHDMERQEKIAVLDLTLKAQDLEKKMESLREDIYTREVRMRTSHEKVEELRKKPFLKKLFRR